MIDNVFNNAISSIFSWNNTLASCLLRQEARSWFLPLYSTWTGYIFDISGMAAPFSRTGLNTVMANWYNQNLSVGPQMAHNVQLSFLSSMERSFRQRQQTLCRAAAHSSARRAAYGISYGNHGKIVRYIQNLHAAAK